MEAITRQVWNASRYVPSFTRGHYESWFQRANHPTRPLAFWIRYTIFAPAGRPTGALGELWAIYFDGENERITAAKEEHPVSVSSFSATGLEARIAEARLNAEVLTGKAALRGHEIGWDLTYESPSPVLHLLTRGLYEGGFPKAKALVGSPGAVYSGELTVDDETIDIDGWVGSQNHNWGSKHTDQYAWAQVAGFDDAPDAFLECASGRLKIGPAWTPWLTPIVLRLDGREYALNSLVTAARAKSSYDFFDWKFETATRAAKIEGRIWAPARRFVGLTYFNPPGGSKTCLNSKLASCEVTVTPAGGRPRTLRTGHRAAFEILTDRSDHGVPMAT